MSDQPRFALTITPTTLIKVMAALGGLFIVYIVLSASWPTAPSAQQVAADAEGPTFRALSRSYPAKPIPPYIVETDDRLTNIGSLSGTLAIVTFVAESCAACDDAANAVANATRGLSGSNLLVATVSTDGNTRSPLEGGRHFTAQSGSFDDYLGDARLAGLTIVYDLNSNVEIGRVTGAEAWTRPSARAFVEELLPQ